MLLASIRRPLQHRRIATALLLVLSCLLILSAAVSNGNEQQEQSCTTTTHEFPDDPDCHDTHPSCAEWAANSECVLNPGFMLNNCQESCLVCLNATKLRQEGILDETEIHRRQLIRHFDRGVHQAVLPKELLDNDNDDDEYTSVNTVLKDMEEYIRTEIDTIAVQSSRCCRNTDMECAYRASQGACHLEIVDMMLYCPLVCRYCHVLEDFYACRKEFSDGSSGEPLLNKGELLLYERIVKRGILLNKQQQKVSFATASPNNDDDPWVVQAEDFLTSDESRQLIELSWKLGYSSATTTTTATGEDHVRRTTKSASCRNNAAKIDCSQNEVYRRIVQRLAELLNVPETHLEPFEFIQQSTPVQSYGPHHDFQLHDLWKPVGARLLTVYVSLSENNDSGGGMRVGFPDLNWLSISPKKGQLLVWPNLLSSDPSRPNLGMTGELLPATIGSATPPSDDEQYGFYTWVRMYDYD